MKLELAVLSVAVLVLLSSVILPLATVRADPQGLTVDAGTLNGSYAGIDVQSTGKVFVTGSSILMGQWPTLGVLLTYTSDGNLLFRSSYPEQINPQDSFGTGVVTDTSQNVYFAGTTKSIGAAQGEFFNGFLVKYNPSMDIVWQTTWGGSISDSIVRGIATDQFDNVYVVGTTNGLWNGNPNTLAGLNSVFLLKYQGSEGVQTFQATWGGITGNTYANGIAVDGLGHVYIVGTNFCGQYSGTNGYVSNGANTYGGSNAYGGSNQYQNCGTNGYGSIFLLKYDLTGDLLNGRLLWQTSWGGYNATDYGYGVALDPTGNVYVVGTTHSYGLNPGQPSVVVLKYAPNGQLLSQKIWGGNSADYGFGITTDILGNVYVVGTTYSYAMRPGHPNVFLLKYDPSGNLLYQKTWGGALADYGYAVAVDSFGNVYVTGYTYSFSMTQNLIAMFLLKYDSDGNMLFQRIWSGTPLNR